PRARPPHRAPLPRRTRPAHLRGHERDSEAHHRQRAAERMKVNVIGGGPAGLYFALLMKRHAASHEVTVFERNPPDATFGWGVVFSGRTLSNLREADEVSHRRITASFETWDNVDVVLRDSKITVRGNHF